MSVPNKNRFGACKEHRYRSGGDVGPSGDGNGEEGGGAMDTGGRKEGEGEGDDNRKKGKKVSILGFRKVKRSVQRRKQKGNSFAPGPGCLGRAAYGQCFLCLKPPRAMDSQSESQASDPNSPDFGYEMLRVLIEKNDFYSKECNPHIDEQFVPSCPHQTIVNTCEN